VRNRDGRGSHNGAMAAQVPCIPIEPDKQGPSKLFGCRLPSVGVRGRRVGRDFRMGRGFPGKASRRESGVQRYLLEHILKEEDCSVFGVTKVLIDVYLIACRPKLF
jgi:hypothetical protein